jgi:hypothetical protein
VSYGKSLRISGAAPALPEDLLNSALIEKSVEKDKKKLEVAIKGE